MCSSVPFLVEEKLTSPSDVPLRFLLSQESSDQSAQNSISISSPDLIHTTSHSLSCNVIPVKHNASICTFHISCSPKHSTPSDSSAGLPKSSALPNPIPSSLTTCTTMCSAHHPSVVGEFSQAITDQFVSSVKPLALPLPESSPVHSVKDTPSETLSFSSTSFFPSRRGILECRLPLSEPMIRGEHQKRCDKHSHDTPESVSVSGISPTGDLLPHPPYVPCPSGARFTSFASSSFFLPSSVKEDESRRMGQKDLHTKEGQCSTGVPLLRTFLCQMDQKYGQENEPKEAPDSRCKSVFQKCTDEKNKVEAVFASDSIKSEATPSPPKVRKGGRQSDDGKGGGENTRVQRSNNKTKKGSQETKSANHMRRTPFQEKKDTTTASPHAQGLAATAAVSCELSHVCSSICSPSTSVVEGEQRHRTPPDKRPHSSHLFPSLEEGMEGMGCDRLGSTSSVYISCRETHCFDNEEQELFSRCDSAHGLDIFLYDEVKDKNDEEEEEKRILAAMGTSNEEEEEGHIDDWEEKTPEEWFADEIEENRVVNGTATCSPVNEAFRSDRSSLFKKEFLTDSVLHRLLGCHRLERVTRAAFRMNVRHLDGVERLSSLLPSLISLRLNSSFIPSTRCLGIRYVHLKVLWLNRCHLKDLLGIGALAPVLTELYVAFNNISDLSPLLGVSTTLEVLDVEGNQIKDVASLSFVLKSLSKAHTLTLQGNPAEEEVSTKMLYASPSLSPRARWREPEEKQEVEMEKYRGKEAGLPPLSTTPMLSFLSLLSTAGTTDSTATTSASATNARASCPTSRSPPTLIDSEWEGAPQLDVKDLQEVFGCQNPFLRFRQWVQQLMPWLQYLDDIPTLRCRSASSPVGVEGINDSKSEDGKNKIDRNAAEEENMKKSTKDHPTVSCSGVEHEIGNTFTHAISPTPPCTLLSTTLHPSPSSSSLQTSSSSPSSLSSHPFRSFSLPLLSPHKHKINTKVGDEEETLPAKNVVSTSFSMRAKSRMINGSSCVGLESDSSAVREELRFLQDCVREHGSDTLQQTLLEQNDCLYASRPLTSIGTMKPRARSSVSLGTFPFTETTVVDDHTLNREQNANPLELPTLAQPHFSSIPGMKPTHPDNGSVTKKLATFPLRTMTVNTETGSSIPRRLGHSCDDKSDSRSSSRNPTISVTMAHEERPCIKRVLPPSRHSAPGPYTLGDGETNEKKVRSGLCVSSPSPRNELVTSVMKMEENKAKREEEEEEWDRLRATLQRRKLLIFSKRHKERITAWNLPTTSEGKSRMRKAFDGYLNSSVLDPSLLSCTDLRNENHASALSSPSFSSSLLFPASTVISGLQKGFENNQSHVRNDWPYVLPRPTLPIGELGTDGERQIQDGRIERKEEKDECVGGKGDEKKVQECPDVLLLKMLKMKKEWHSHNSLWKDVSSEPQMMTAVDEEKDFNTFLKEEVGRTRAQIARDGVEGTTCTSAIPATRSLRHIWHMRECKRKVEDNAKMRWRSSGPHNALLQGSKTHLRNRSYSCHGRGLKQSVQEMDFFANESNFEVVELGGLEHSLT